MARAMTSLPFHQAFKLLGPRRLRYAILNMSHFPLEIMPHTHTYLVSIYQIGIRVCIP